MASYLCCLLGMLTLILFTHHAEARRKAYIVYMGEVSGEEFDTESTHLGLLGRVLEDSNCASEYLLHSYKKSFNAFAAMLTKREAHKLSGMEGIVSVFPSKTYRPQTTRSWSFLGFQSTVKRQIGVESNLIVGVIDSGIWPESESFHDNNLGPPPTKWKGICQNFTCNNKIIGARFYYPKNRTVLEEKSSRDTMGHGSHTAATIAGVEVNNASYFGLAKGTARGGVPSARIAAYKVCWNLKDGWECPEHEILAAFRDAIDDGVDIISISIGAESPKQYFNDTISIGSFHAMKAGILTVAGAGNWGPMSSSVVNASPWIFTVAASSIDRSIINKIKLGNGEILIGKTINRFPTQNAFYPLESISWNNVSNSFNSSLVNKNVLIKDTWEVRNDIETSAQGVITYDDYCKDFSTGLSHIIPGICFNNITSNKLMHYLNTARNPVGKIYKTVDIYNPSAPIVLSISSRGPNPISPDILKPDISAPGIEILAAWSPKRKSVYSPSGRNSSVFKFATGTSMACPHVTGAAVYVKTFHPSWSPSAIKSAIMTTALPMSIKDNPQAEFAFGVGHLNPVKALDPGLIYDTTERDYVQFLCSHGYDLEKIKKVTEAYEVCDPAGNKTVRDLNQPTMTLLLTSHMPFKVEFPRIVTNVGMKNSSYLAHISCPSHLNITVEPNVLSFKSLNEKKEFRVTVSGGPLVDIPMASASLTWFDGKYSVRSPIVVYAGK